MNANRQKTIFYKIKSSFILSCFVITTCIFPGVGFSQGISNLPVPGTMIGLSAIYNPAIVAGITLYPDNPLQFDFIIDTGDDNLQGEALRKESEKLIHYFMATLTVPEEDMWVNLSPYEKDRIIAEDLGHTAMGRDMLAQDYILKQLSASLMYPEEDLGSEFWQRVQEKTQARFGTSEVPTNTFNKIWIVPEKATIYMNGMNVFVADSHLKVMMEEDYLALEAHDRGLDTHADKSQMSDETKQMMKEIILPEIEKEVNQGRNFAPLRQIYHSMILATWYKNNLKESLLSKVYANQNKVDGVDLADKDVATKIYDQYVEAFKAGVYDYIREEYDATTQEVMPKKYFSGGVDAAALVDQAMSTETELNRASWLALRRENPKVKVGIIASLRNAAGAAILSTALATSPAVGAAEDLSGYKKQLENTEQVTSEGREKIVQTIRSKLGIPARFPVSLWEDDTTKSAFVVYDKLRARVTVPAAEPVTFLIDFDPTFQRIETGEHKIDSKTIGPMLEDVEKALKQFPNHKLGMYGYWKEGDQMIMTLDPKNIKDFPVLNDYYSSFKIFMGKPNALKEVNLPGPVENRGGPYFYLSPEAYAGNMEVRVRSNRVTVMDDTLKEQPVSRFKIDHSYTYDKGMISEAKQLAQAAALSLALTTGVAADARDNVGADQGKAGQEDSLENEKTKRLREQFSIPAEYSLKLLPQTTPNQFRVQITAPSTTQRNSASYIFEIEERFTKQSEVGLGDLVFSGVSDILAMVNDTSNLLKANPEHVVIFSGMMETEDNIIVLAPANEPAPGDLSPGVYDRYYDGFKVFMGPTGKVTEIKTLRPEVNNDQSIQFTLKDRTIGQFLQIMSPQEKTLPSYFSKGDINNLQPVYRAGLVDRAMKKDATVGGIDFNSGNLELDEQGQIIENIYKDLPDIPADSVNGAVPVIINMAPITNFPLLLGLDESEETDRISFLRL